MCGGGRGWPKKTPESVPPQLHLESMSREASAWIEGVPGSGCVAMCCSAKVTALEQVQHKDEAAK